MNEQIDDLYKDLLQAQLDKDWRKADELQRKISRIEEAEERLPERPFRTGRYTGGLSEVYEVAAPYARS